MLKKNQIDSSQKSGFHRFSSEFQFVYKRSEIRCGNNGSTLRKVRKVQNNEKNVKIDCVQIDVRNYSGVNVPRVEFVVHLKVKIKKKSEL